MPLREDIREVAIVAHVDHGKMTLVDAMLWLIADGPGPARAFALLNRQERGELSVGRGVEAYEGMIVGESARAEGSGREPDGGEEADEHALVDRGRTGAPNPAAAAVVGAGAGVHQQRRVRGETPEHVRLRKMELSGQKRQTAASRKARGLAAARP
jgi:GTP-binding protein